MAGQPTEPFRAEHTHLLGDIEQIRQAAREIPELSLDERVDLVDRILDFIRGTLMPHAEAEEQVLYPEVAKLLGHPGATAPMSYGHLAIHARTEGLADSDPADTALLQELLYGLYAVHFWKEEEIYLPLLDTQPGRAVRGILARMGELEHTSVGGGG